MRTDVYKMEIESPQIAIAGRVLRGDKPISGARVKIDIESSPESFQAILSMKAMKYGSQWENMSDRPDRKITASDGYFFFVNLPDGNYSLEVSVHGRTEDQIEPKYPIKVERVEIDEGHEGIIQTVFYDIHLRHEIKLFKY